MSAVDKKAVKSSFSIVDYAVDRFKYMFGWDTGTSSGQEIPWGPDDKLPSYLFEELNKNVYFGSIINGTADMVWGGGIKLKDDTTTYINENMAQDLKVGVNFKNEFDAERRKGAVNMDCDSLADIVRPQIKDRLLTALYSTQMYFSPITGKLAELQYKDVKKCRLLEGRQAVRYHKKGHGLSHGEDKVDIPLFNILNDTHDVCMFMPINKEECTVYPLPYYYSALSAIDVDTDIVTYNKNTLKNGFMPFHIITVPGSMTDDEMEKLDKNLKTFSSGVKAMKYMLVRDDGSGLETRIGSAPQEDIDNRFKNLSVDSEKRIFTGFRAPKQLFGNQYETTGFSEQEYESVFELYFNNMVLPFRELFINDYEYIFGIKRPFEFIPSKLEEKLLNRTSQNIAA